MREHILQDLLDHVKEYNLFPKTYGKSCEGFKQDMIRFTFQKEHFGCFVKKGLEGSEKVAADLLQDYGNRNPG